MTEPAALPEIQANADDVITLMTEKIGAVERQNAILMSQLFNARKQIAALTPAEDAPAEDAGTEKPPPRKR